MAEENNSQTNWTTLSKCKRRKHSAVNESLKKYYFNNWSDLKICIVIITTQILSLLSNSFTQLLLNPFLKLIENNKNFNNFFISDLNCTQLIIKKSKILFQKLNYLKHKSP